MVGKRIGRPPKRVEESDELDVREAQIVDKESETIELIQTAFGDDGENSTWLIRVNQVVKEADGATIEGWVFNANIQEISTLRERIATECGPGRYRCRVQRDGKAFKQYDLVILLPLSARRPNIAPPTPATPAPTQNAISPELLRVLDNQNRMIEAIANRPAGPSMTDLLSQMKLMREMMPEPAAPNVGFDMFMKALTVAKELVADGGGGGGDSGSPIISLVEKLVPMLLEKLPALAQIAQQPPPAQIAPPIMQHQPAPLMQNPVPQVQATESQRVEQADKLKSYLLGEAAKGTDPAMCADYLQENMPPELSEALLQADDPLALVLQVMPEAVPHKAWFGRLLDLIFEPLEPDGPVTQGAANGNAAANRPN